MTEISFSSYADICIPQIHEGTWTYGLTRKHEKLQVGDLVWVELGSRQVWGICTKLEVACQAGVSYKPVLEISDLFSVSAKQLELLKWMSQYYLCSLNRVLDITYPKKLPEILLEKKGERKKKGKTLVPFDRPPLTEAQKKIHVEFENRQGASSLKNFLLHGVTGSGKTRVLAEWALTTLKQGKQVLWMVPEIALTPQTQFRLESYLGVEVALWHSSLKLTEKRALWRALAKKEIKVLLGTRSSILAPLDDLGLILVDEEHDASYKQQDPTPRYQAKDVALMRGIFNHCSVVFASATPSLESLYLTQTKKMHYLYLGERAQVSALPQVSIVDLKEQRLKQGARLLSIPLREALEESLAKGEQAILLHNRRGYATSRVCLHCGEVQQCEDCKTTVVWHKFSKRLHCHHCARIYLPMAQCKFCGAKEFDLLGSGIQKVEEELQILFPDLKLLRMDRDTTQTEERLKEVLEGFRSGEASVLLGTQMVAKGHDFPNVQLVGVIDADIGAQVPDFRATERLFQMITQVAGRAGRLNLGAKVIVQTWNPSSEILNFALAHQFEKFSKWEFANRKQLNYPPLSRWLLVECSGKDKKEVNQFLSDLQKSLEKVAPFQGVIKGPVEPQISHFKGVYKLRLVLQTSYASTMGTWIEEGMKQVKPPRTLKVTFDRDPQSIF